MMRALFSGVSGLKSHQTRMDVIGNNIANVNTTGFKSKRLNFADMLYQTTQAGSASNTETQRGGINPRQIGLGVKTGAINTSITTEGASQSTGNPFDLKLTGEAFFIVSDGTNTYYTRDGSFDVDDAGYLVMANTGYTVMGWTLPDNAANDETATIVQGATVKPINVKQFTSYNPGSTTGAYFSGIIDKNDSNLLTDTGRQVNLQFYDKMGYEYNLKFGIKPVKDPGKSTRDVENKETLYTYANGLYVIDNSKKTYTLTYPAVAGGAATTADWKEGLLPDVQEKIENLLERAHTAGAKDPVKLTFSFAKDGAGDGGTVTITSDPAPTAPGVAKTEEFHVDYNFGESILCKKGVELNVTFDGTLGYSTTKDKTGLVDVSKETLEAILPPGSALDTVNTTTPLVIPSIRITTQSYTDEAGNPQTKRKIEKGDAAGGFTEITNVEYGDLTGLLAVGKDSVISQYMTTEEIDATGNLPGQYVMTLLGMTDSTGATVNISNLGDVTYDLVYNTDNGLFSYVGSEGNDTFTLNLSAINSENNFSDLTIDMSDTKNVDNEGKCTLEGLRSDGRKDGKWTGVSIGTDGTVTVNYSNGMTRDIAQIAVATFGNAMGLENAGDNLYEESQSSGEASIVDIAASGTGYMTSGVLEMSNVDLSQEFTEMITTQRGFQANSRIITTSDSILEELVNLKR